MLYHPEVKKLKTWDMQIRYLIKQNYQLTNEIKLWSSSAIYNQYMMLAIMKHTINSENQEKFDEMRWMIKHLHTKLQLYNKNNIDKMHQLFN